MSRVQLEIALGVLLVLVTGAVLIVYGINEQGRMEEFALAQRAVAIEVGAALFESNCSSCHGIQGQGVQGLCPPLNDRHFFDNRVEEVGWTGSIEDYIVSTVSSGRLTSTRPDQYPGNPIPPAMPAWSERYGGPLREDQIRDIAAFIMNWESTAGEVTEPATPTGPLAGTDITIELPAGDAATGEQTALGKGCTACHVSTTVGPAWMPSDELPGIGERAETRLSEPDYAGEATSPEQYLFESIVHPDLYVVPGYQPGQMPQGFAESLSQQELADIIAYMLTLR
jgi:mono/diheme cytochrome c family protein